MCYIKNTPYIVYNIILEYETNISNNYVMLFKGYHVASSRCRCIPHKEKIKKQCFVWIQLNMKEITLNKHNNKNAELM